MTLPQPRPAPVPEFRHVQPECILTQKRVCDGEGGGGDLAQDIIMFPYVSSHPSFACSHTIWARPSFPAMTQDLTYADHKGNVWPHMQPCSHQLITASLHWVLY